MNTNYLSLFAEKPEMGRSSMAAELRSQVQFALERILHMRGSVYVKDLSSRRGAAQAAVALTRKWKGTSETYPGKSLELLEKAMELLKEALEINQRHNAPWRMEQRANVLVSLVLRLLSLPFRSSAPPCFPPQLPLPSPKLPSSLPRSSLSPPFHSSSCLPSCLTCVVPRETLPLPFLILIRFPLACGAD